MLKILAVSDLHGNLPNLPEFDLLLIAGDICPSWDNSVGFQKQWIINEFVPWLQSLKYKDGFSSVFMIAGNHDKIFETMDRDYSKILQLLYLPTTYDVHYLHNNSAVFRHPEYPAITVYGTPYCKSFGNWSYMKSESDLGIIFNSIPEKVDILLTHSAPYGEADFVQIEGGAKHEGSIALRTAIIEKKPKINICGHFHDLYNSSKEFYIGETRVINVASVGEDYDLKEKYYTEIIL